MKALFRNHNLLRICGATILSTTGSWLLIYTLSTTLFLQTGSLVASSLVLLCKIFPSAFAGIFGGYLADRISPKKLLLGVYLLSAGITTLYLMPVHWHTYWLLYPLIFLRSIGDHTDTVGKEVSVVYFFDPALQIRANTLINTANLVSMACAGALGIYLLQFIPLPILILIDAGTFVLSAGLLLGLQEPAVHLDMRKNLGAKFSWASLQADLKMASQEIRTNPMIKDAIAYGATLGIFLEGSRFVLHHYMGLQYFHLGPSGVSRIVAVEAVGMIIGGGVTSVIATWLMGSQWKLIGLGLSTAMLYAVQIHAGTMPTYLLSVFWTSLAYQIFDIHTINMMIGRVPSNCSEKFLAYGLKCSPFPRLLCSAWFLRS